MTSAVLSLGSNMNEPRQQLSDAVHGLGRSLRAVSSVYRTPPWGPVPQDDYLNLVVLVDDDHTDARGWLERARQLEQSADRIRQVRWGPRSLDVDVITVDGVVSDDPELTLPHPRAHERAFVLVPWAELDPTAVLPGHGRIEKLLAALPEADRSAILRVGHVH